jgi:predicted HAD superfamily Cof-like phosphohydrolase
VSAARERELRLEAARSKVHDYLYDRRENGVTVRELGRRAGIGENAMLKLLKEHGYDPKKQRRDDAMGRERRPPMGTDFQALVRNFHEAHGGRVRDVPKEPGVAERQLRHRLIAEEATEVLDALRIGTLAEVAHETVDLIYVLCGAAVAFGIDLAPIFEEIHRANLAKVQGGRIVSTNGKIQKPPGWTPPDVAAVLRKQGWKP